MTKVINAAQAAELIKDGVTVAAATHGLAGWPEEIALAVQERYIKTGHPQGITFIHASGLSGQTPKGQVSRGECAWAEEGLVKRLVISHVGTSPRMAKAVEDNKVECYFWPLGVITQWYTEVARKTPGLMSRVGVGTFIDPRVEGGKANSRTTEDLIQLLEFKGQEFLLYKSFPVNIGLIRGTNADEEGNITIEKEAMSLEWLPIVQAVKASGGIVIAQVENLVKAGTLHPQHVRIPGICVDYIVVAEKPQWQNMGNPYKASLAGDIRIPESFIVKMELDERKIIARRAAMELQPGPVNLGIGIPQGIANVVAEEGCADEFTFISESGVIGGIPGVGPEFGCHYNGEAMLTTDRLFTWFDGGGLTMAFVGLAQADRFGNINAGTLGGKPIGPGGFINITQSANKVVFCGVFNAGKIQVETKDGKLAIVKEAPQKKFLNDVEQIAFNGNYSHSVGQEAIYITERAVFANTKDGLMLTEIAPGIDLQKDVLGQMEFKPIISPDLKLMDEGIFQPVWGGLKRTLEERKK